jgi:hypothetical protein
VALSGARGDLVPPKAVLSDVGSPPLRPSSSFPSSAWERTPPKLRFKERAGIKLLLEVIQFLGLMLAQHDANIFAEPLR